jgi:septal ring factor EnvC (AmiA/AmiB activator)
MAEKESWHLNKSVPVTILLTLFLNTAGVIWMVSQMNSDIEVNKRHIAENVADINKLEAQVHDTDVEIGRIGEFMKNVDSALKRIERKLEE